MQPMPLPPPPKITRFRRAVLGLGGATALGLMAYAFTWTDAPRTKSMAEERVTTTPGKAPQFLVELREDYTPPEPKPREAPKPTAPPQEPSEPTAKPTPPVVPEKSATKQEPAKAQQKAVSPRTTTEIKPSTTLFATLKEAKPPFSRPKPVTDEAAKTSASIKPAPWVTPEDPRLVLYPDQVIAAITEQNINSDEPGTLRFLVTQHVVDTQGGNHVLIPQFTRGVATMDGGVKDGQERVPFRVKSLRLPDGTFLPFDAQLGDRSGANALPGKVDRHLGQKAVAIFGSALLSVGARVPFGSTDNYQPNLAQEFSSDFARGVNQAGQQLLSKALARKNTITQEAGYPITIQFLEPMSFQHAAVRTGK